MTPAKRRAFILANTRLQSPPRVPEVTLHLADEITPLWQLTEREMGEMELPPPFWAFAWPGGQGLARYLLDHPEEVRGRRVLDFATGSGLVAIAAMKAGAVEALGADIEPFCEAAVALNATANGVELAFTSEDLLAGDPPAADVILAADVSYEKPVAERVRGWLDRAAAGGARVLMGDPDRVYFEHRGLKRLAMYDVATTRELEDREVKRAGVWTFA
ncbi:MAG TPA: methyltransferase [Caulobacteraceae bacterium]